MISYNIGGIDTDITCTSKGIFHIICTNGSVIPGEIFFSKDATEAAVSPTDTVFTNSASFDSWWQTSNCLTGGGELRFYETNVITHFSILLHMHNKLWYTEQEVP